MPGHCPLCLKDLKEPVCLPCGHVYCSSCIGSYATGHDKLTFKARCPLATCRQDFNLFIPDINALPKKFRSFVTQPMRRVHLSSWGTEEDLQKERDQYKQVADNMRIANTSLESRAQAAERDASHYKRLVEQMSWHHDEEKKGLEARIQILESRLTQAECRNQRIIEAAVEESPRLGKRRRMSFVDEKTLIASESNRNTVVPDLKGKEVETMQSAGRSENATENLPPQTPKKPWIARTPNPNTPLSSRKGFRFAFRAPSASLLALRGPSKRREYSHNAPRF